MVPSAEHEVPEVAWEGHFAEGHVRPRAAVPIPAGQNQEATALPARILVTVLSIIAAMATFVAAAAADDHDLATDTAAPAAARQSGGAAATKVVTRASNATKWKTAKASRKKKRPDSDAAKVVNSKPKTDSAMPPTLPVPSGSSGASNGSGTTSSVLPPDPSTTVQSPVPAPSAPERRAPAPEIGTAALGVFRGSYPDQVAQYEAWLGRPVPYALEFTGRGSNWDAIARPTWVANHWNGSGRTVVFSVAMLPSNNYTLAAGASGAYDEHWRGFAQTFVNAGRGDAIIRLGWEFNGKFYPWAAGGKEDAFAAYWRRIVDVMRSVPGADFQYDWTPLAGNTNADVERAYPGDDYVDFIGLDAYDTTGVRSSPEARWADLRDRRYGLAWHRDFAAAHGKPMTFPEWGLSVRPDNLGGGDNPHYIEQMHKWISSNNVAYAMYFEFSAKDAEHRLMTNVLPSGSRTFLELFGG